MNLFSLHCCIIFELNGTIVGVELVTAENWAGHRANTILPLDTSLYYTHMHDRFLNQFLNQNGSLFLCTCTYRVDMRSNNVTGKPILVHKKGSKVTGLHCHPLQPDILLSCGNDHFVRFYVIFWVHSLFWALWCVYDQ